MTARRSHGHTLGARGRVSGAGLARPAVVLVVLLLHGTGLWALQSGLTGRPVEQVVPVQVVAQLIEPSPVPEIQPAVPLVPRAAPVRRERPVHRAPERPRPAPVPQPVQVEAAMPETAPLVVAPPPAPAVAAAEPRPAPPAPAPPPPIVLPSSTAAYLNNPPPPYPAVSFRLNEQGVVVVRVFIKTDGTADQASVSVSSGFPRLDQAALRTVRGWRYVPGKKGGVSQAMWFDVPVRFVIE